MWLLDRYIIGRVLKGTALGVAVLSVLMALFLYVNEQGWVGVGSYGNLQAAWHVLLTVPTTLPPFLPVAALFGALMAIGQLSRGSELTVMRAAGVSVRRIGSAVLVAGLLLLPLAWLVAEHLAPPLARMALETRTLERDGAISLTPQGAWLRDGSTVLRANAGAGGGYTLFEFAADRSLAAVAQAGGAHALPDGGWELEDVRGTRLAGDRLVAWNSAAQRLPFAVGPDFFNIASTRPDQMSLADLARTIDYLVANGQDTRQYRFAFWAAIARLIALPLAMLLAVPLVMGRMRGAENAARMTVGLVLGLVWYIAQRMVESGAIAFGLSPSMMALLPTLLLAAAVLILLWRLPRISAA